MIAVDTNILVYSHRADSPFHRRAKSAVESLRDGTGVWAIAWPCIYEFICIVTHPKIYKRPSTMVEAIKAVERWNDGGNLHLLHERSDFWPTLAALAVESGVKGPQIHDARIAALCLRHGVRELWSADRDFSVFPRLKTRNPLVA